jgi:hypothetical protein
MVPAHSGRCQNDHNYNLEKTIIYSELYNIHKVVSQIILR